MWRRAVTLIPHRHFSSTSETPTLYSFLHPSIFNLKTSPSLKNNVSINSSSKPSCISQDQIESLESTLYNALFTSYTDQAWKSFKSLTTSSAFPSKSLTNSLVKHLASLSDTLNLKRAFASVMSVKEKNPQLLDFETVHAVLNSMKCANTAAPAFALVKCMFKNRFFLPFGLWGDLLVEICRNNGKFAPFSRVFQESCKGIDEKLEFLKPNLAACNAALEGCCRELESVSNAESVIEMMPVLGIKLDESSFGFLAYLYALKGLRDKIDELKDLMGGFGFSDTKLFYSNLVSGYVKSGNLECVSATMLCSLREEYGKNVNFSDETYCEVVKGFLKDGSLESLAQLIIEAQKIEPTSTGIDKTIGFGIISACVNLGLSDKAHSILDEMDAEGGSVGLGVHVPILKAYCKENRAAEATQLVMEISNSDLQLDVGSYDSLIEASMTGQDFRSAFTLCRDMREARIADLKGSYLTIMTGLMENHRPELMAAFMDEVVEDPRLRSRLMTGTQLSVPSVKLDGLKMQGLLEE